MKRLQGHGFVRRARAFIGLAMALVAGLSDASAQTVDCQGILAQLASLGRSSDSAETRRYQAAAEKQRYELDRTIAYSKSLGCDRQQFLFFGAPPPPQCPGIATQIQRMQSNYNQLVGAIQRSSGEAQRRDLQARYDSYCRGTRQAAVQQPRNFFDQLFGGGADPRTSQMPLDPADNGVMAPDDQDQQARGGPKAVCVKVCDGGFFPVSYSATRRSLTELDQICKAQCPNAEASVYTYSLSGDIDQAVSLDGTPYADLPNAGKFRTKFDPSCTCKPANRSWAQALAEAEQALGQNKSDILVTAEKSAELSRPKGPDAKTLPAGRNAKAAAAKGKVDPKAAIKVEAGPDDEVLATAEAAAAERAPTAGQDSSGIGTKSTVAGKFYGASEGEAREMTGPDGVRRKVRVVGPTF